jgi:hypothetical protein
MYNELGHYFLVLGISVVLTYNKRLATVSFFFFFSTISFFGILFYYISSDFSFVFCLFHQYALKYMYLYLCLLESKAIFVKTSIKNRRFFMVLSFLIAAFLTPSDIWCQIVACLFIYLIIELTTFYALIIRVYKKQLALF